MRPRQYLALPACWLAAAACGSPAPPALGEDLSAPSTAFGAPAPGRDDPVATGTPSSGADGTGPSGSTQASQSEEGPSASASLGGSPDGAEGAERAEGSEPSGEPRQSPEPPALAENGPHPVQSYSTGFRVGPDFPGGTVWYPEDAEAPLASIAIVPGFVSPRSMIEAWGPFFASHGIVAFTVDTNLPTDLPDQRSRALLNALESLQAENTRAGSPLFGKLDTERLAVGGHSMGGGGTLITADGHPELKAALPMCAWSPGGRFSTNGVPTLLFASAGDPLAGGQSQGFYRSIPDSTPKMLFEWGVADHMVANEPTGALGQVGHFALAWLKVFLEGDESYREALGAPCDGCTDFQTNL